jgi:hypothetical protein
MRDWLVVAAILGCLIVELLHPVLTRAGSAWRDPTNVMLEASDVGSARGPASSPIADLFAAGKSMALPVANSLDNSVAPAPHRGEQIHDRVNRSPDSRRR